LFHRGLRIQVEQALDELAREVDGSAGRLPALLVGYPEYQGSNGAPVISMPPRLLAQGQPRANHRKNCLPNYRSTKSAISPPEPRPLWSACAACASAS
jgi:hypothetical protein